MSRPLNKAQLLASAQKEYAKLEKFLASLMPEQLAFSAAPGAWAVKDVLAHLYEWQQMLFTWYETGLRGETPAVPAPGYKWSQLPALNQAIYERHQQLSAGEALDLFRESHQKTIQFIENLSDADLSTPGLFGWMNNNTLMAYLNSVTAAHYVWALKEAKKVVRPKEVKA
ncbi:MAG: ClbS/DfsB family four-helix bundle protein [Anaerolineae bacterium]|nr:ClbS/DfsB family four-helix bundle protein [Anaerolineae bacterium]